jgi:hypothetical protein
MEQRRKIFIEVKLKNEFRHEKKKMQYSHSAHPTRKSFRDVRPLRIPNSGLPPPTYPQLVNWSCLWGLEVLSLQTNDVDHTQLPKMCGLDAILQASYGRFFQIPLCARRYLGPLLVEFRGVKLIGDLQLNEASSAFEKSKET